MKIFWKMNPYKYSGRMRYSKDEEILVVALRREWDLNIRSTDKTCVFVYASWSKLFYFFKKSKKSK